MEEISPHDIQVRGNILFAEISVLELLEAQTIRLL
jgi:hypothetical protein